MIKRLQRYLAEYNLRALHDKETPTEQEQQTSLNITNYLKTM